MKYSNIENGVGNALLNQDAHEDVKKWFIFIIYKYLLLFTRTTKNSSNS